MTPDPLLEHVIVNTEMSRIDRIKAAFRKNKFELILGALLGASVGLNGFLLTKPAHVCKYDLNSDDIDYLNRLLEEDQARNGE